MALVGKIHPDGSVTYFTERRYVPDEASVWFDFRKLTGPEMDEASDQALDRLAGKMKALGELDLSKFRSEDIKADESAQRRATYDLGTLIRYGVVAWCYEEPCDDEHKAQLLDAATRDWAVGIILDMNTRTEAEKKGSSASLASDSSPMS